MKSLWILMASVAVSSMAFAQQGPYGSNDNGQGVTYQSNYQAIETVSGKVKSVDKETPPGAKEKWVVLTVKSGNGRVKVWLAPVSNMDQQQMKIESGDHVRVTGRRIEGKGKLAYIAYSVQKDGQVLNLRDSNGGTTDYDDADWDSDWRQGRRESWRERREERRERREERRDERNGY